MLSAAVVKLADTQDLESCGAIRIGSNPIGGIRRAAPFFKNGAAFSFMFRCVGGLLCVSVKERTLTGYTLQKALLVALQQRIPFFKMPQQER